jgi:hypothetical protein
MVLNVKFSEQQHKLDAEFKEQLLKLDAEFRSTKEVVHSDFQYATVVKGSNDHTKLTNRDADDQHPISSITGLEKALDELKNSIGGIVGGSYDEETKEIVFELENGNTIRIPASDLLGGFVTTSDLESKLLGKVDKVTTPNVILGTDENGNPTTYSIEGFGDSSSGKTYVKEFTKYDFEQVGTAQRYYLTILQSDHKLKNPYVDKVLVMRKKDTEEETTFYTQVVVEEKILSMGTVKIYLTIDLTKYDYYKGKIFLKGE